MGEACAEGKKKHRGGGGLESLLPVYGGLGGASGFPPLVGLHTTPALDPGSLECSSHRGLRSITR